MNVFSRIREWWVSRERVDDSLWDGDSPAWLASLLVHLGILFGLALITTVIVDPPDLLTLITEPRIPEDPLTTTEEFRYSDTAQDTVGAAAAGAESAEGMLSSGPLLDMTSAAPSSVELSDSPRVEQHIAMQNEIRVATGPRFTENLIIKGAAGVGATGTGGAIDQITQEILLSLEQRRTLVVWLFDQSGSLARQRREVFDYFSKIYDELGVIEASGNPAFKKHDSKPLLTSVMSFGDKVSFLTPKPTDDVDEIKSAVKDMATDDTGVERTFEAVLKATERFRSYRAKDRNVMFVIFTDEVGNDEAQVDQAVTVCRNLEIPVYCVGVPAPFGRREVPIKYVDPDPKFDQTPRPVNVEQGPESMLPEMVQIAADEFEEALDSGFGPYALTRLCYETGGSFFAVHPNRDEKHTVNRRQTAVLASFLTHFFDREIMRSYRPDYVTAKEYQRLLNENRARKALVEAAQMSRISPMTAPVLVFPKQSDADLANRLTQAQHVAAELEPKVKRLYDVLHDGEKDRPRLTRPRWQAGYDCSMGRVLAVKTRTEGYNMMLAKAKQGMRFQDAKNDTWRLVPSAEISVGSTLEKQAEAAKEYLERVVQEHPGTPWALLASKELEQPLGWKWEESYTGVNAPRQVAANNNNKRPMPRDDKAKMLPKPVKRPAPKL